MSYFDPQDVISTYTDSDACEDGGLVPISRTDRVTRTVWEWMVEKGPKTAEPPNRWPVDLMGWFTAAKIKKEEALGLIARYGAQDGQKRFERLVADRKALAMSKGIISTHASQAKQVYEQNVNGGIHKLYAFEDSTAIKSLSAEASTKTNPQAHEHYTVLWLVPNEVGGITLMFPEDY